MSPRIGFSSLRILFIGIQLFIVFPHNPFYSYKVGSNVPSISDSSNMSFLFFLVNLAKSLSLLLLFL